jgi:hypothetical protein
MLVKRVGALVMALGLLGALIPATAVGASNSYWNVAGTYSIDLTYPALDSTVYKETLILTQSGTGTITGTSLCCSLFTITSGTVVGDTITINGNPMALLMRATITPDGDMVSGTWATNDGRGGAWVTTSGQAKAVNVSTHAKADIFKQITPGVNGADSGAVIFNSSAGNPNNLELTLQLKKVMPDTAYDVYLFLDTWASGSGVVVGTFTTNGVGNGTFHVNTQVSPGFHTVAIDVTRAGSGADVYVTAGLYGQNLWLYFQ